MTLLNLVTRPDEWSGKKREAVKHCLRHNNVFNSWSLERAIILYFDTELLLAKSSHWMHTAGSFFSSLASNWGVTQCRLESTGSWTPEQESAFGCLNHHNRAPVSLITNRSIAMPDYNLIFRGCSLIWNKARENFKSHHFRIASVVFIELHLAKHLPVKSVWNKRRLAEKLLVVKYVWKTCFVDGCLENIYGGWITL